MAEAEPNHQDKVENKPQDQTPLSALTSVSGITSKPPAWVLVVSVISGLAFLILLLAIAVWISYPTSFQIFIFRVVLGLAAAAFGATIPGFLRIDLPLWGKGLISATGALALFVVIYMVNPPALVDSEHKPPPKIVKQSLAGVILDTRGNPLPGVTVTLPAFSLSNTTDTRGIFSFEVRAEAAASVRLMAQKPGYQTHRQDATLGNTQLSFTLERQP
jgi:hypothetical protein